MTAINDDSNTLARRVASVVEAGGGEGSNPELDNDISTFVATHTSAAMIDNVQAVADYLAKDGYDTEAKAWGAHALQLAVLSAFATESDEPEDELPIELTK